jgi:hypothetical protein
MPSPETFVRFSMPVRKEPGWLIIACSPLGSISCHRASVNPSSANLLAE